MGQRVGGILEAPIVRKNVVIGAYSIILGGIEIGEGALIGAGSLVLHDVPPHTIYYNKREENLKHNNKAERSY